MRRGVEIQGNLTFSPGTTARQIEARGASMLHKVYVMMNGVRGGPSEGVRPTRRQRYVGLIAGDSLKGGIC